jgi:hypothetical protein
VRDFTDEQVETAIEFVIRHGARDRGQSVAYSRVFKAAGLPAPQDLHHGGDGHLVTDFMEAFHVTCVRNGLPPLDALVVHVAGPRQGFPGAGFFRVNGEPDPLASKATPEEQVAGTRFWERAKDECRRWGRTDRQRSARER